MTLGIYIRRGILTRTSIILVCNCTWATSTFLRCRARPSRKIYRTYFSRRTISLSVLTYCLLGSLPRDLVAQKEGGKTGGGYGKGLRRRLLLAFPHGGRLGIRIASQYLGQSRRSPICLPVSALVCFFLPILPYLFAATPYDTAPDVVAEVTYMPSPPPRKLKTETPPLTESKADDYVRMIRDELPYSQSFPVELFIARELSNPHSREKKRQRYLAAKARQQALLKQYIEAELNRRIEGRSKSEAIAEARFKWRERMRLDRKADLKRRWVARGLKSRLERRRRRAQEKQEAEKKKLRELILREAPNQVVPRP